MMGSEEPENTENINNNSIIPTLPLFSLKSTQNYSSNLTSPLHTSASVPFKWEEHPGKPLPCLALALPSTVNNNAVKSLELPPRLLNESKFTKTPSPTTVLEGPYCYSSAVVGKSSSFRFLRKRQQEGLSFDGTLSLGGSPERGLLGTIVLSRNGSSKRFNSFNSNNINNNNKGLFGSWRKRDIVCKNRDVVHGGNFVFPTFLSDDGCDGEGDGDSGGTTVQVTKMSKKTNFLGLSQRKSHFWAAIYGAFKQVMPSPRRSTKWKKDAW